MINASIGIRAYGNETGYSRPTMIMLSETTYRVWSTIVEQALKEKKLWAHVVGSAVRPPK